MDGWFSGFWTDLGPGFSWMVTAHLLYSAGILILSVVECFSVFVPVCLYEAPGLRGSVWRAGSSAAEDEEESAGSQ